MSETKQYTIEFVYSDNHQIFQTGALLDDDQRKRFEGILDAYSEAGAIEQPTIYNPESVPQTFDQALSEVMTALEHEVTDGDDTSECQNCGIVWPDVLLINPIPDLQQRVAKGEPMPSGECRACGALCQPSAE